MAGLLNHATRLVNEYGNVIHLSVIPSAASVRVRASGPVSAVDHVWTRMEAAALADLLLTALSTGGDST